MSDNIILTLSLLDSWSARSGGGPDASRRRWGIRVDLDVWQPSGQPALLAPALVTAALSSFVCGCNIASWWGNGGSTAWAWSARFPPWEVSSRSALSVWWSDGWPVVGCCRRMAPLRKSVVSKP